MQVLDAMIDVDAWRVRAPGGGASDQLRLRHAPERSDVGSGGLLLTATARATGHFAERRLEPAADLSAFDDLQAWVRSDRRADGSPERPFFLEVRLGSPSLPVGAPENPWHRLIPIAASGTRQAVVLSISDLPDAVRRATSILRITCIDAGAGFECHLQAVAALREAMLADVDAALVARLGGHVRVAGTPVPAVLTVPDATPPDPPFVRITNVEVHPAPAREPQAPSRTDHVTDGFALRPPPATYDLFYEIAAVAAERAAEAALLEHVLAELGTRGRLAVNGRSLPVEFEPLPTLDASERPERVLLRFRVEATQRRTATSERAVPPHARVDVEVDSRAIA